jgi:site-specific DNA-methyltransferase (adenine-specific)
MMAQKPKEGTFKENWKKYKTGLLDLTGDKTPGTLLFYPKPGKEEKEDNFHPTIKPLALMKHLVNVFSSKGNLVIDPFMGSGTTGVACVETGRDFIGIEKYKKFFEISKKRIKQAVVDKSNDVEKFFK